MKMNSRKPQKPNLRIVDGSDLPSGPSGPYDGGMEERVRDLETSMARMDGKLDDMPTKDWMTTRLVFVVGAFSAVIVFAQYLILG